jgi:acyl carrier protein
VIHAAGVLDDGVIREQTAERLGRVLAPKASGAWRLHEFVRTRPVDHFILFSSAAALLGAPGQSNYAAANAFLDGLAHARRAAGLSALSLDWGAWAESGMAARLTSRQQGRVQDNGFESIAPENGLLALSVAARLDAAQLGVMPVNWETVLRRFAADAVPSFLREIAAESEARRRARLAEPATRASLKDQLEAVPPAERADLIVEYLRGEVARVLGAHHADALNPALPFTSLGLDSLMAVELRNALSSALGRTLPASLVFDYPTIDALSTFMTAELVGAPKSGVPAPSAGANDHWKRVSDGLDDLSQDEMAALLSAQLAGLGDDVGER